MGNFSSSHLVRSDSSWSTISSTRLKKRLFQLKKTLGEYFYPTIKPQKPPVKPIFGVLGLLVPGLWSESPSKSAVRIPFLSSASRALWLALSFFFALFDLQAMSKGTQKKPSSAGDV
jgi:hypothetical protein